MQKFIGKVRPFVLIEGLNLKIVFDTEVKLEDWQVNHPHFVYARKNGWVVGENEKSFVLNTLEPNKNANLVRQLKSKNTDTTAIVKQLQMNEPAGLDETALKQILETQHVFIKSVQHSYDKLSAAVKPQGPAPVDKRLQDTVVQLQENQKMMLELLAKQSEDKSGPLLQALLQEIRALKTKNEAPTVPADSGKVVELLEKLNTTLGQKSFVQNYNTSGVSQKENGVTNFDPKFVPRVDDFTDVKNSNIVTQKSSSENIDAATEALKKLRKQKGI